MVFTSRKVVILGAESYGNHPFTHLPSSLPLLLPSLLPSLLSSLLPLPLSSVLPPSVSLPLVAPLLVALPLVAPPRTSKEMYKPNTKLPLIEAVHVHAGLQ